MQISPLTIEGAWLVTPEQHEDDRGVVLDWFADQAFVEAVGHPLRLRRASCSVNVAGALRGLHYADLPPGQGTYVTCASGAVAEVVVDLRVGSPTFGAHEIVLLADTDRRAVYLSEGLGHGSQAITDDTVVTTLYSEPSDARKERAVNPLDPELGIAWPTHDRTGMPLTTVLSARDGGAPTLAEARAQGVLPSYDEAQAYRRSLRR
ncbi:MAG TPA: dTDP-4-dehydrorhamnose 3,5-epimerase [Actinomycetales bacterium]|nr:dTDP-4-dehydrorhamnose 3,5-epimerase [Actinomycetales bacterium]